MADKRDRDAEDTIGRDTDEHLRGRAADEDDEFDDVTEDQDEDVDDEDDNDSY